MKTLAAIERILNLHHELARKIVHVLFGLCFLFAAAIFDLEIIPYLAFGSLLVFIAIRYLMIFPVMHDVYRRTYGEIFYQIGLLAASLIVDSAREFFVCVAVLAFADSAASLAGKWWRSPKLRLGDTTASVVGSSTFLIITIGVLALGGYFDFINIWWDGVIAFALILTAIEAVSPVGSDNVFIPLVLAVLLQTFS